MLIFFFSKRTERNNEALDDLKSQKKKILEEVMEKETYKTAKLILERFDPDSKKAKEFEPPSAGVAVTPRPGQEIRQRTAAQRNLSPTTADSSQGPPPQVPVSPGLPKDTSAPGGPQKELLLQPYRQMCYQDVLDPLLLQCLEWVFILLVHL